MVYIDAYMHTKNFSDSKSTWKVKFPSPIARPAKRNKFSKNTIFIESHSQKLRSLRQQTIIAFSSISVALSRARFPNSGWKSSIQLPSTRNARELGRRLSCIIEMLQVLSPHRISYLSKTNEISQIRPEAGCSPGIFSLQCRHWVI